MKAVAVIVGVFILALLLVGSGCEPMSADLPASTNIDSNVLSSYTPVKVDIMPLTEFITTADAEGVSQLKVYVSLLDSFDCQVKSPGVFRFELYEYVQRSGEARGRRIGIKDIDLTEASENNSYWRDFLRAYEFDLDFGPQRDKTYILQVTCLCPSGKRLSADFALKHAE